MIDLKVTGLDEIKRELEAMAGRMQTNILRSAVRAASQPVRDEARARAPVLKKPDPRRKPGTLKQSITVRSPRIKGRLVVGGIRTLSNKQAKAVAKWKTGGRKGADNPDDPYYAAWVEYGTAKMRARPFMRPALSTRAQSAIDVMGDKIRERINAGDLTKK